MQSILNKAKERIGHYNSNKNAPQPDESSSFSRKRKGAALRADLFAGPDKIVSASNTYGLIRLTIHEAKVQEERRYCAVISIGMQVQSAVWMHVMVSLQQHLSLCMCNADLHVQDRA